MPSISGTVKVPQTPSKPCKPNRRLGNRKSRNGCRTCRKRRVKCGEETPMCKRCLDGNYRCEGYRDNFILHQNDTVAHYVPLPSHAVSLFHLEQGEARAFQYYLSELAYHLGGPVDSSFWTSHILQLSWHEPAVQHALVAVSHLCEQIKRNDANGQVVMHPQSLKAYQRALAVTNTRIADGKADIVALTTCILFLCVEYLRRGRDNALTLVSRGAAVLRRYMEARGKDHKAIDPVVENVLLPLFERLALQAAIFNQPLPAFRPLWTALRSESEEGSFDFDSIPSARSVLYSLLMDAYALIRKLQPHSYGRDGPRMRLDKFPAMQAQCLAGFSAWESGIMNLLATLSKLSALTNAERNEIAILRMYHAIARAWLRSVSAGAESAWDEQYEDFETVVGQASTILGQPASPSQSKSDDLSDYFSFEMGVIPPLHLTATKCRDPKLRARALNLLRLAPRQEALWTRADSVRVASRVIELEQTFLKQSTAQRKRSDGNENGLQRAPRIAYSVIHTVGLEKTKVTMLSHSEGPLEVWKIWEETISDHGAASTESSLTLEEAFRRD